MEALKGIFRGSLKEALTLMSEHNLGVELTDEEKNNIILFLETLTGERPKILDPL
ncbi:MAG: hypothetical protein PHU40_04260 [Sulfurimonas sp.]|nr:hypothetical protein [Sulfurimonas sp.]